MCQILRFVIVAVLANLSLAKVIPDFITVCPGFKDECLKSRVQEAIPHFTKGIPSLGIITTDPLKEDSVKLELPGNFKVELYNGTLTGLRKCIVDDVKYANDEVGLTLRCNVTIKGKYKANGQILIVRINGDGDAKIKVIEVIIRAKIKLADVERDGKVYYEIKDLKIQREFAGKVQFYLTNLFKGNPELSNAVLLFLNEQWKQIVEEFGAPIFDRLVKIIFSTVKIFFEKVPKEELY